MDPNEVKADLRYSKEHEWIRREGDEVVVGITAFAVDQLGDVTLVSWDVKVGENVKAGQVFGTIESVKTLSDLFAPVAGKVLRINQELEEAPELVNADCWEKAWMIAIAPSDPTELDELLDAAAYRDHVASAQG